MFEDLYHSFLFTTLFKAVFQKCGYGGGRTENLKNQWGNQNVSTCNFTKSNTPPRVFFTFFKLPK